MLFGDARLGKFILLDELWFTVLKCVAWGCRVENVCIINVLCGDAGLWKLFMIHCVVWLGFFSISCVGLKGFILCRCSVYARFIN